MRLKDLFIIPDGQKVTEKQFRRVLISSICSILLCMSCLVGTTWAWFVVSIENTENVIQTADVPKYILQVDGQSFISGENLPVGEHTVSIAHASDADDLQKKSKLYVTFALGDIPHGYIILGGDNSDVVTVMINTEKDISFSWTVSWFVPGNPDVNALTDNVIRITAEDLAEETTAPTEATNPTEESTGATDTTEESTGATDTTEESTGATDTTEESTGATDTTEESTGATDTTEESTGATDTTEESTGATDTTEESMEVINPTEESTGATDPTEESTEATDPTAGSFDSEPQPSNGTTQPTE